MCASTSAIIVLYFSWRKTDLLSFVIFISQILPLHIYTPLLSSNLTFFTASGYPYQSFTHPPARSLTLPSAHSRTHSLIRNRAKHPRRNCSTTINNPSFHLQQFESSTLVVDLGEVTQLMASPQSTSAPTRLPWKSPWSTFQRVGIKD